MHHGAGTIIDGKYELVSALGQGGMGSVRTARHRLLDVPVAVKLMSPVLAASADARARFWAHAWVEHGIWPGGVGVCGCCGGELTVERRCRAGGRCDGNAHAEGGCARRDGVSGSVVFGQRGSVRLAPCAPGAAAQERVDGPCGPVTFVRTPSYPSSQTEPRR